MHQWLFGAFSLFVALTIGDFVHADVSSLAQQDLEPKFFSSTDNPCQFMLKTGLEITDEQLLQLQEFVDISELQVEDRKALMALRRRALAESARAGHRETNEWGSLKAIASTGAMQTHTFTSRERNFISGRNLMDALEPLLLRMKSVSIVEVRIYHNHPGHGLESVPLSHADIQALHELKFKLFEKYGRWIKASIFAFAADRSWFDHHQRKWRGAVAKYVF